MTTEYTPIGLMPALKEHHVVIELDGQRFEGDVMAFGHDDVVWRFFSLHGFVSVDSERAVMLPIWTLPLP